MRFVVDMPLSPELAEWLNAQGHDAVHVSDLSMHQSSDSRDHSLGGQRGPGNHYC
jgi:predicted nuclease of predicted toxin-antitoxin system